MVAPEPEIPVTIQQDEKNDTEAAAETANCSCIAYLVETGILVRGNAIDLQPNVDVPRRGDVLLLVYKNKHTGETMGHGVRVEGAFPGGDWISERNFTAPCEYSERFIPHDDPHRRGYLRTNTDPA